MAAPRLPASQFRSTPPREGRRRTLDVMSRHHAGFDPRPRARGDCRRSAMPSALLNVSIHAPARGATASAPSTRLPESCFDPRPRARGDATSMTAEAARDGVSIHAPARGATPSCAQTRMAAMFRSTPLREGRPAARDRCSRAVHVSIHAPARGATARRARSRAARDGFDPRPRARGDRGRRCCVRSVDAVSIHAPARGATGQLADQPCARRFRSTPPREGRRRSARRSSMSSPSFDPRPRARGDSTDRLSASPLECFDPRPCARGDRPPTARPSAS